MKLINLLIFFLKIVHIWNEAMNENEFKIEFDSLDKDLFDELAPEEFKYKIIMNKLKRRKNDESIVSVIDQTIEKIKSTYLSISLASYFIGEHKFRERDWRKYLKKQPSDDYYNSMFLKKNFDPEAKFMISFPEPPISNLFPNVAEKCEKSAFLCLEFIAEITKLVRGFYLIENRTHVKSYDKNEDLKQFIKPFNDQWQLFNLRATASYYLCWYTLNRNPLLRRTYNGTCPATEQKIDEDFKCSEISFCPDVCCGQVYYKTRGTESMDSEKNKICFKDKMNPCNQFSDPSCRLSYNENKNFNDLKLNKINISCKCPKGFRYFSEIKQCIDINECEENIHYCSDNQSCLNTTGSFKCVCPKGFLTNNFEYFNSTENCINEQILFENS